MIINFFTLFPNSSFKIKNISLTLLIQTSDIYKPKKLKIMNSRIKMFRNVLAIVFLFAFSFSQKAQVEEAPNGCNICFENNTGCTAFVIVNFYCDGLQITDNARIAVPPGVGIACVNYPTVEGAHRCPNCDVSVRLVSLGGAFATPANICFASSPGFNPIIWSNGPPVNCGVNPGDFGFSGSGQTVVIKP